MPRVLSFNADDCLITDESTLSDFPEPDDQYLRRIGIFYGIHPEELADYRLVTIFERIAKGRGVI